MRRTIGWCRRSRLRNAPDEVRTLICASCVFGFRPPGPKCLLLLSAGESFFGGRTTRERARRGVARSISASHSSSDKKFGMIIVRGFQASTTTLEESFFEDADGSSSVGDEGGGSGGGDGG